MTRIFLTAIAIGVIVPLAGADAASSKKRRAYEYNHRHGIVIAGPAQAPPAVRRRGPPWAMPNECFNDEGYGRWSPCGGRDR